MTTVLAAIADDQCVEPVLKASSALATLLDAEVDAVHVSEASPGSLPRSLQKTAPAPRVLTGPPVQAILDAARGADVVALVLGSRGARGGPLPAGRTALALITQLDKPVVVVPPHARPLGTPLRILVPLEQEPAIPASLTRLASLARAGQLELVVVHVHDPATVPAFGDHAPHSAIAWEREFLSRHLGPRHERITMQRRLGAPADEILAVAETARCDVIALTWYQDLSAGHARVVQRTLSLSPVATLLLPRA